MTGRRLAPAPLTARCAAGETPAVPAGGLYRVLLLSALIAVAGACHRGEELVLPAPKVMATPADGEVVAVVAGQAVTADEVRRAMVKRGVVDAPNASGGPAARRVLEEIVRTKALAAKGRELGYDRDVEVREVVDLMVADRYLRELMALNMVDAAVPEADVQAYYERHREQFSEPERARGAVIVIRDPGEAPPAEREAVRELAESIRRQVAESAAGPQAFAALARQHSVDAASRDRGGDVGWLPKGAKSWRVHPAVVEAIFALGQPGDVAPVIEIDDGLVVARLTDRAPAQSKPLTEVAPAIREILRAERERALKQQRIEQLVRELDVRVHDDVLARIGSPEPAAAARPPAFPVAAPSGDAS